MEPRPRPAQLAHQPLTDRPPPSRRYAQRSACQPTPTRAYERTLRITQRCSFGSPISPLLANIALHTLDEAWQASGRRLGVLAKYADDLVAVCATREQAEEARELVAAVLDPIGLRLHPEKTRIVHLAQGAEGFDFLGFHHRMRKSWRTGYWYLQKWPSKRAMTQIKGKIRDRTQRRYAGQPLEWAVE
ncbi:MAG: hypothetical protein JO304_18350, partial [Solirubrobacterales bacterium]|nr:hypothetical protein [Solirubrobacterales bacterium]